LTRQYQENVEKYAQKCDASAKGVEAKRRKALEGATPDPPTTEDAGDWANGLDPVPARGGKSRTTDRLTERLTES